MRIIKRGEIWTPSVPCTYVDAPVFTAESQCMCPYARVFFNQGDMLRVVAVHVLSVDVVTEEGLKLQIKKSDLAENFEPVALEH